MRTLIFRRHLDYRSPSCSISHSDIDFSFAAFRDARAAYIFATICSPGSQSEMKNPADAENSGRGENRVSGPPAKLVIASPAWCVLPTAGGYAS